MQNFDYEGAKKAGYSDEEINKYLSSFKPEKSFLEKTGRIGAQLGIGALESAAIGPELVTGAINASSPIKILFNSIDTLEKKKSLRGLSKEEESQLEHLNKLATNPKDAYEEIPATKFGLKSTVEKVTGIDLTPEGMLEKAANWIGFIKKPSNLLQLAKSGLKSKDLIKSILPSGKETLRGLGAGGALQLAEEGQFGPMGTIGAAIVGDLIGGGIPSVGKALKQPKETLAKTLAKMTGSEKAEIQKELIDSFRKAGIQADLGTITDNNLIKLMQSRISQSGLVGKELEQFRENLNKQVIGQYEQIANQLGEAKFSTPYEAGQALQETLKASRDADLNEARKLYSKAEESLHDVNAFVESDDLLKIVEKLESKLKPGSLKGTEQESVIKYLEKLKTDLKNPSGDNFARVDALINDKKAISDIVNYEVQGGQKQLLKGLAKDIDKAILQHGKYDRKFAKDYINANKKFEEHAKTFRNKRINQILMSQDADSLLNKMNSTQGIRDVQKALSNSSEGKKVFEDLKRFKLEEIVGKKMVDSISNQVKLGTFSHILEKGKNREIVKSLLSPMAFKRLDNLSKITGKISETANKYYNASKSGSISIDAAAIVKLFIDFSHIIHGNPWPLVRSGAMYTAIKGSSKLMTDPKFLKMVEDAIIASNKNDIPALTRIMEQLSIPLMAAFEQEKNKQNSVSLQ